MHSVYQIVDIALDSPSLLEIGREREQWISTQVRKTIEEFLSPTGAVDADLMMSEWFPDQTHDVFISHSRADKELALSLSGFLEECFGLTSFVDSCAWSHADILQRNIDDKWCYQSKSKTYSYEKRNVTTAHVHTMLSTALTKMMDRCECVLFLNTENSTIPLSPGHMVEGPEDATRSPWLFHELSMMSLLRRKPVSSHRPSVTILSEEIQKSASDRVPAFLYRTNLADFPALDWEDLNAWGELWAAHVEKGLSKHDTHPLDLLYGLKCPDAQGS